MSSGGGSSGACAVVWHWNVCFLVVVPVHEVLLVSIVKVLWDGFG